MPGVQRFKAGLLTLWGDTDQGVALRARKVAARLPGSNQALTTLGHR